MTTNPIPQYPKDPAAVIFFTWNWSTWLTSGETISSASVSSDAGLTIGQPTNDSGKVTAQISDGAVGRFYEVACQVTTTTGRVDVRRIQIAVLLR